MTFFRNPDFPFSPRRFPFFYGWLILGASVFGTVMSIPGQTMGVGVFTDFLLTATGLNRLQLSTAYMLGTIASSLILPYSGKLLDSKGSRFLIVIAALGLGVSLVILGQVEWFLAQASRIFVFASRSVLAFCLMLIVFMLIRQFGQGLMALSSRTMLTKWFDRKRGLAVGISGVFVSFGFSGSPLFLNWMINRSDWQTACFQLAVVAGLGAVLVGWVFFRDNPEECGLRMDGAAPESEMTDSEMDAPDYVPEIEIAVNEARKTYTFWVFNIGLSLYGLIITAVVFHIASLGATVGLERSQVFALFLPISLVSISTNLIAGWLSDRIQLKNLLIVMMAAMFFGTIAILFLDTRSGMILLAMGLGISGGLFGCLTGVVWPRYFGRKHLGAIAGLNMASMVFASAIGPPLFGLSQSLTSSYDSAAWVSATLPFTLFFCAMAIKKHPPAK